MNNIREHINKIIQLNENLNVKPEVELVYKQNPELNNIGTLEQYNEYLNTIFPNSKVKDIVYHNSPNKIEKFRDTLFGTYFSYSPIQTGAHGNIIHKALLNVQNPLVKPKPEDSSEIKNVYNKDYRNYNNSTSLSPEGIPEYKYDASIETSTVTKDGVQIRVRTPEQIHILGSKQDIQNFKNYLNK